jgi:nucleotide-binding universal stress UspA family protein
MKVLLPLDIVQPVKPIVGELAKLVPLKNAEVLLLFVKEELPAYEKVVEAQASFAEDWGHQVEKRAQAAFADAREALAQACPEIHDEIVMGPAALMIETVAKDEKFDLTCVTPGSHSAVEMFFLGSVSSKVVKHGPGTILIVRPRSADANAPRHVVMGIDGSPQSREAIELASKQLNLDPAKTTVTLINVVSVADVMKMVSPVEYISAVENNLLLEGETFLADGKRLLSEHGFQRVECVLKEGDPATEIINLARALPADLVVIGAQGRTAVQHFLLGSVSHRIAMHAPCSVAVVKSLRNH